MPDAESIGDSCAETLHHDIGGGSKPPHDCRALRCEDVGRDAVLPPVQERAERLVQRSRFARFDPHDVSAEVRKHHRRHRTCGFPAEVDHPEAAART